MLGQKGAQQHQAPTPQQPATDPSLRPGPLDVKSVDAPTIAKCKLLVSKELEANGGSKPIKEIEARLRIILNVNRDCSMLIPKLDPQKILYMPH